MALADGIASQYKPNLERGFCEAAERAAKFLVMAQMPVRDGGVGWSWVLGDGTHPDNIAGLAALALLDGFAATGNKSFLVASQRYADSLVAGKGRFGATNLPYKADIELLSRLGGMPGGEAYRQTALEFFGLIRARSADGRSEVERIAQGRRSEPALLGFDVALAIRAAATVGERPYAYALADEVIRRSSKWYRPQKDPRFSLVAGAALATALERLDAGHYRARIDRLRADLVESQQENGSWLENETQPSAYATLGLLDSFLPGEQAAAVRGLLWLKSTMLRAGGFAHFNDYMPEPFVGQVISEVNAEVLSALAQSCKNGLDKR